MQIPEPPLDPPDDSRHITTDCGHEVYDGEDIFEWENGNTLCCDCLEDLFSELTLIEKANLFGCEHRSIRFHTGGDCYGG